MIYDVAVVGGGPGGYAAAIRVSQLGGRPVLIEAWLPPDLPADVLDDIRLRFADAAADPHAAAAEAWEYVAAAGTSDPTVVSASTGAQSVTYSPSLLGTDASMRARYHRARARAASVQVEPAYLVERQEPDENTYYLPPRGS